MDHFVFIRQAKSQLNGIMASDAAWCRKRLAALQNRLKKGRQAGDLLKQVSKRIEQSRALVEKRQLALPRVNCDPQLPICAHREELVKAIRQHQVIIVAGETGSG